MKTASTDYRSAAGFGPGECEHRSHSSRSHAALAPPHRRAPPSLSLRQQRGLHPGQAGEESALPPVEPGQRRSEQPAAEDHGPSESRRRDPVQGSWGRGGSRAGGTGGVTPHDMKTQNQKQSVVLLRFHLMKLQTVHNDVFIKEINI